MYGMVNQAIKDLVVTKFNDATWAKMCTEVGISTEDFVLMEYYEDSITYRLVGAASKLSGLSPEAVLREFGKFWVLYTAKAGYGAVMDLFGQDFETCLANLNHLHTRMGLTMPNLKPPKFAYRKIDEKTLLVQYFSERKGLSPMVLGLLEGLAEKYNQKANIDFCNDATVGHVDTFTIHLLG